MMKKTKKKKTLTDYPMYAKGKEVVNKEGKKRYIIYLYNRHHHIIHISIENYFSPMVAFALSNSISEKLKNKKDMPRNLFKPFQKYKDYKNNPDYKDCSFSYEVYDWEES